MVIYTELNREDALKILDLGKQLHQESHFCDEPFDQERCWALLDRTLLINSPIFIAYSKDESGEIKGFILGTIQEHFFSGALVVQDYSLYVKPEFRGSPRLASSLIDRFEEWARSRGAISVTLYHNTGITTERSVKFIERKGYQNRGYILTKELK